MWAFDLTMGKVKSHINECCPQTERKFERYFFWIHCDAFLEAFPVERNIISDTLSSFNN